MRIMTFNIQHALDYQNQKIDTDLFVRKIKEYGADICGLNEVRGDGPLEGYTDQTNAIGDGLGFYRYFGEAIRVDGTSPYGNAIVSKIPLKSAETIRIPDPQQQDELDCDGDPVHYESRCIIKAILDIDGKDICILVTHMGLAKNERINAVSAVCDLIEKIELPLILMGDFNSTPDDEVLIPLFEKLTDSDVKAVNSGFATYPSYEPEIKIDYIFYRGLECEYVETVEEIISDHYPIVADFKL